VPSSMQPVKSLKSQLPLCQCLQVKGRATRMFPCKKEIEHSSAPDVSRTVNLTEYGSNEKQDNAI
jgi:hypothetical protein